MAYGTWSRIRASSSDAHRPVPGTEPDIDIDIDIDQVQAENDQGADHLLGDQPLRL
jgi:hypothetical protein